ncbi:uncharacterized protein LOC129742605 [Uranotaenia lowii]|uniref:uncharacterized protein LOC129742605 n=1 Tax=Uranotaenia lowii TaxID=190385 RepID=UPI002478767C|nr:uncharacterized protein LOC129742605 [Uranotaenia lowii]
MKPQTALLLLVVLTIAVSIVSSQTTVNVYVKSCLICKRMGGQSCQSCTPAQIPPCPKGYFYCAKTKVTSCSTCKSFANTIYPGYCDISRDNVLTCINDIP